MHAKLPRFSMKAGELLTRLLEPDDLVGLRIHSGICTAAVRRLPQLFPSPLSRDEHFRLGDRTWQSFLLGLMLAYTGDKQTSHLDNRLKA